MQTLIHARPDALVAIHDFANRPGYHTVREVAREVATSESFSVFVRKFDYDPGNAMAIPKDHTFDPA